MSAAIAVVIRVAAHPAAALAGSRAHRGVWAGAPPGAGSDDLDDPDTLAAGVELAECLRADGYDVKDPEPGKGLALDLGVIPDSALQKCAASTTEGDK